MVECAASLPRLTVQPDGKAANAGVCTCKTDGISSGHDKCQVNLADDLERSISISSSHVAEATEICANCAAYKRRHGLASTKHVRAVHSGHNKPVVCTVCAWDAIRHFLDLVRRWRRKLEARACGGFLQVNMEEKFTSASLDIIGKALES